MAQHNYELKTYNGRVKIYCDGYVMFAFNQIDFSGHQLMEIYFKTKENWLGVLKLLDTI